MKMVKDMNCKEKRVYKEVKAAFNSVVGRQANLVYDGQSQWCAMFDAIYDIVLNCESLRRWRALNLSSEICLEGRKFIEEVIEHVMKKNGYTRPEKPVQQEQPVEQNNTDAEQVGNTGSDKEYFSIVRDKEHLRTAKFEVVKVIAKSKAVVEDILFDNNLAPFANKIYTEKQFNEIPAAELEAKGIEASAVETARIIK